MNKRKIKIICIAGLLILTIGVLLFLKGEKQQYEDIEISLKELKNEQEYQFAGIEWGSSCDEVREVLPYNIVEDPARASAPEEYDFYTSEHQFILDGKKATPLFEFYNDGLNVVKFNFKFSDNNEEWIDNQVQELVKLYGKENRKTESALGQSGSGSYIWETETSMIQFTIISGKDSGATVMLAVGRK